ncbi:MAG: hypothetical protein ACK5VV_13260, partial [Lysobacteraceae bacterium]
MNRRLVPLALLATVLAACGGSGSGPAGGGGPAIVTTATVEATAWVDRIEAIGTARASESIAITS